jgi:hypothetical protein
MSSEFHAKQSDARVDGMMHFPYPPAVLEIQDAVEKALGVGFNQVMLNRYGNGEVCIGKHSDAKHNQVCGTLVLWTQR